ncbi:DUF309 domain-containing protein [Macrococcus equi]|uniref:DUF309 domain-containing protein n=1 Tax=Macrococcus equi TaxID=3395462 RepID=UPI0039BE5FE7
MHTYFDKAFIDYLTYFHKHRDYFECHEIMEEAWKGKPVFSKHDPEVALIMLATAMYHLRRNNTRGAITLFTKTKKLLLVNRAFLSDYIDVNQLITQIDILQQSQKYTSIVLPLKYHHIENQLVMPDKGIIDKHKMRDRTEVIQARLDALYNKYPVKDAPNKTHHSDKTK